MTEKLLSYFNGDVLAAEVWKNKYAAKGEETPDDMFRRLAKEFARIEEKYIQEEGVMQSHPKNQSALSELSKYGKIRKNLTEERIYELFKNFGPIVMQGSVMSMLGTDNNGSLSNCFVVDEPYDSYGGIMHTDEELAQVYKRRGGCGTGVSTLRPKGTKTKNAAKSSTGAISFMHRFSHTTREVAQAGRRGALMLTIDIRHPDIEEFIDVKRDRTQVTGANISIKLRDDFMEAVKNGWHYQLRYPVDMEHNWVGEFENNRLYEVEGGGYIKFVDARTLYNKIIEAAWDNAEPGLLFWDRFINYGPDGVYVQYQPKNTNPCVAGDTLILTDKGLFPIMDLVGQKVNVWNGDEWSEVEPTITGKNQEILRVTLSDGRTLKCTPYHRWIKDNGETIEAKDLTIGQKLIKFSFTPSEFGTTVSESVAYTQGFYSGDGVRNTKTIWLYNGKIDLIPFLNGKLCGQEYITPTGSRKQGFTLGFENREKTWVPFNAYSIKSRLDWFAGLIDADGTVSKEGGCQIMATDYEFLTNVQHLLTTLGVNSKIINGTKAGTKSLPDGKGGMQDYECQACGRLVVGAVQVQELLRLGLKTHRLNFENFSPNRDASRFTTIVSIEQQEEVEEFVYCFTEPKKGYGTFNGILTGQCGEQGLQPYDSCRLFFINGVKFVLNPFTKDARINWDAVEQAAYEANRLGDDLVDLEIEYLERIIAKIDSDPEPDYVKRVERELWEKVIVQARNGRRAGGGVSGLGDMLAMLGVKYDSKEGQEIIDRFMATKLKGELKATTDLAILRGPFEGWQRDLEFEMDEEGNLVGKNDFYKMLAAEFPAQTERMCKYGRRSVSWSTIAPVGTGSLLCQTTSGCEPLFSWGYMRRRKINPGEAGVRVDFVDANGDSWTEYPVLHYQFKVWIDLMREWDMPYAGMADWNYPHDLKDWKYEHYERMFKISPWYGATANDIDWIERVRIQAILQKYTTNAISSTINLPRDVSKETVAEIYMKAWELGCKGQTIYRDGCRDGVLITEPSKKEDTFEYKDAYKRPKTIPAKAHLIKNEGQWYTVFVGLVNDKPYEVFCDLATGGKSPGEPVDGTITKLGSKNYEFKMAGEDDVIKWRIMGSTTPIQNVVTRMVSFGLRHYGDVKYAVEQLYKCDGSVTSFANAIARVLKTYIPDGEKSSLKCSNCGGNNIIFQNGCHECRDCGSSKCG